jgi:hypothetical protein
MKRTASAALLAAIICMVWGTLSWMVLGWHNQEVQGFKDEATVARVLRENALRPGVYMLPHSMMDAGHTRAAREATELQQKTGPFLYGVIRPGVGGRDFGTSIALGFGRSLLAGLLIAILLGMTARLDFLQRVLFCTLCGLFVGVVADVPMHVWFESPLRYTLINVADHVVEWFLAGLAIAGLVTGKDL